MDDGVGYIRIGMCLIYTYLIILNIYLIYSLNIYLHIVKMINIVYILPQ